MIPLSCSGPAGQRTTNLSLVQSPRLNRVVRAAARRGPRIRCIAMLLRASLPTALLGGVIVAPVRASVATEYDCQEGEPARWPQPQREVCCLMQDVHCEGVDIRASLRESAGAAAGEAIRERATANPARSALDAGTAAGPKGKTRVAARQRGARRAERQGCADRARRSGAKRTKRRAD